MVVIRKQGFRLRRWVGPTGKIRRSWSFDLLVDTIDGTRRVRRSGYPTRKAAQEAARLEAEVLGKETQQLDGKGRPATFHTLLDIYSRDGLSNLRASGARSERESLTALRNTVGDIPLGQLNALTAIGHSARRKEQGKTPYTIRREVGCLRRVLAFAVARKWITERVFEGWPRPVRLPELAPTSPTREQVERVLSVAPLWLRCAIALAATCGLRKAEVEHLRWRDLDFDAGTVLVACSHEHLTKSGKSRLLGLPPGTLTTLETYRRTAAEVSPERWVFPSPRDASKPRRICDAFRSVAAQVGEGFTFHALRSFFAEQAAAAGIAPAQLQAALGHSSLLVTKRYLRRTDQLAPLAAKYAPDFIATQDATTPPAATADEPETLDPDSAEEAPGT